MNSARFSTADEVVVTSTYPDQIFALIPRSSQMPRSCASTYASASSRPADCAASRVSTPLTECWYFRSFARLRSSARSAQLSVAVVVVNPGAVRAPALHR